MKNLFFISLIILLSACTDVKPSPKTENVPVLADTNIVMADFQKIIDAAEVEGSVLIYNSNEKIFYSNDFDWANKGHLPASTFKIPNSLIALETGLVESDSSIFIWDGVERWMKTWNQDLTFHEALQYSCVPIYQAIAANIGVEKMREYLDSFNYTNMKFDSLTIDDFWLSGESRINQFEQINFLKKFYQSELPISARTERIMKKMLVLENNESDTISGKTGWSNTNDLANGWFVGYIESEGNVYFFATNISPLESLDINNFASIRKEVTFEAYAFLKEIE